MMMLVVVAVSVAATSSLNSRYGRLFVVVVRRREIVSTAVAIIENATLSVVESGLSIIVLKLLGAQWIALAVSRTKERC